MRKFKLIKDYPNCHFTVGDIVETWGEHGFYRKLNTENIIKNIYVENFPEFWEEVIEEETIILTDGVAIKRGSPYWGLGQTIYVLNWPDFLSTQLKAGGHYFSSPKTRDEYKINNEKCLTFKEVIDIYNNNFKLTHSNNSLMCQEIKKLVKQKLNIND